MIFRKLAPRLCGLLAGLLTVQLLCAEPVNIEAQTIKGPEYGAGISVGKGQDCFVITPAHVVAYADTITVKDQRGARARARIHTAPDGVDAVLLKIEADHALSCPEDWNDGSAAEAAMANADFVVAKKILDGGLKQKRFFPAGVELTTLSLEPYGARDKLSEGDSGSSLFLNNRPLGMIVSVDTATGVATAIKQSQLHALFANAILSQQQEVALLLPVYENSRRNPYASDALRKFINKSTPYKLVEYTEAQLAQWEKEKRYNKTVVYPPNVDYVIYQNILKAGTDRIANSNYSSSASSEKNFGKKLLNRLGNRNVRYYLASAVDIEVTILMPKDNQQARSLIQRQYKTPQLDNTNSRDVLAQSKTTASVDAMKQAMLENGLIVLEPKKKKKR